MTLGAARSRLFVVLAWAAFFHALWLSGASTRFLGARTQSLVPFGALTLTLAAALAWRPTRKRPRTPLRSGEAVGLFAMLLPLTLILLVPHAELGAYAAAHKSNGFFPAVKPAPPPTPRDVTLLDVRVAEQDPLFALASHIHPGTRVDLLGIVTHTGPHRFSLTRFYITCCVADAQPLTIDVTSARPVAENSWLSVTGTLRRARTHYRLDADRVRVQRSPADPYLSFAPY